MRLIGLTEPMGLLSPLKMWREDPNRNRTSSQFGPSIDSSLATLKRFVMWGWT